MSEDTKIIEAAIRELALALLYKEYGKDMKNHDLIRTLAHDGLAKFAEQIAEDQELPGE